MSEPRRVLIVEDNALNQKLLVRFLRARGFELQTAATTAEAEASLRRAPAALILMDVSLPGEDGLSFVRRLRQGAILGCEQVPVVAITAHALITDREAALAAGCQGHLTKPVDLRQVEAVVREHLAREVR